MFSDQPSQLPKPPANKSSDDKLAAPLQPNYIDNPPQWRPTKKSALWVTILVVIIVKLFGFIVFAVVFGCYYLLKQKLGTWRAIAVSVALGVVVTIGTTLYESSLTPSFAQVTPSSPSTSRDNVGNTPAEPASVLAQAQPNLSASNMPTSSASTVGENAEALPQSVTSGPNGLVAISNDSKAMANISHFTAPKLEIIQAFFEPSDKARLDAGEAADGARYVLVSRMRDPALQSITSEQFQYLLQQARQQMKSVMQGSMAGANTRLHELSSDFPDYKSFRIDKISAGTIVIDKPTCFARVAKESYEYVGGSGIMYMVAGMYHIDGKLFFIGAYAHSDAEDVTWLSDQGVKWLRGQCTQL